MTNEPDEVYQAVAAMIRTLVDSGFDAKTQMACIETLAASFALRMVDPDDARTVVDAMHKRILQQLLQATPPREAALSKKDT